MLVNLGIGLPSLVANYVPAERGVFFQAENGIIGLGARPPEGMEDRDLTDAGGGFVTAVPGAASIDSAMSFGLIRGGHLDMTVLGGLQVDEADISRTGRCRARWCRAWAGRWTSSPARASVVVAMQHAARGASKIVPRMHAAPHRGAPGQPDRDRPGRDPARRRTDCTWLNARPAFRWTRWWRRRPRR
jgi:acetate CoA/acetoacetate CoA-transferase beta subunit